jgi:hypothetical protein
MCLRKMDCDMVMLNLVSGSMLIARDFHGDSFVWLPVLTCNIAQWLLFSTFMVTFSSGYSLSGGRLQHCSCLCQRLSSL